MTDAHCHVVRSDTRHLLCEPCAGTADFYGCHPWHLEDFDADDLRARLIANPRAGVGEIGLDRLKDRHISPRMRAVFAEQLRLAAELHRPVVLHGAKCWGEVVKTIRNTEGGMANEGGGIPSFLFHGFSRSGGLIPDIIRLNGFISVGPALMNDHAVNYRNLIKAIPLERLLVESDATAENAAEVPSVEEIAAKLAELRGLTYEELEQILERNLEDFLGRAADAL
ncbi:MAG: TatD family hydrolase [Kiritimatiellia bacterium]